MPILMVSHFICIRIRARTKLIRPIPVFTAWEKITKKMSKRLGSGTVVIPAPKEVDAAMKKIRSGKLTTIELIRNALAEKHGATIACPMTTGIFAWIASHAADEAEDEGRTRITPYWRTLKSGGELNPKYPGGVENLKARLTAEGHSVVQKGKRFVVEGYDRATVQPKLA